MAIVLDGTGPEMIAFAGLTDEQIARALRKRLEEEPNSTAYVLRYGGEIARVRGGVDGECLSAVIIEGATPDMSEALQWAYFLGNNDSGEATCIDTCENYFRRGVPDDDGNNKDATETSVGSTKAAPPRQKWWEFWKTKQ